jgi:hypothetical protein
MDSFDSAIAKYFETYQQKKRPINVNFRQMVSHLNNPDRATHLIHTYPAKLLMHIPYFFLNNNFLSKRGDKVLDSFCGSGTVLLEAMIAGRKPVGADSNPLARLIARTKTRTYDPLALTDEAAKLVDNIDKRRTSYHPNVVNLDYWFLPNIIKQLSSIKYAIAEVEDSSLKDFFEVCFSNLVRKVSLADPRISVPVRLNPDRYHKKHDLHSKSQKALSDLTRLNAVQKFNEIIQVNIRRYGKLRELLPNKVPEVVIAEDARDLNCESHKIRSNSVQLYISSPPYAGAQKYIRSSSLSLGWLDYTKEYNSLQALDRNSIGRENYLRRHYTDLLQTDIPKADRILKRVFSIYPKRAHIAAQYLLEMKASLEEANRVLKKNGYLVLVAANNQVCGNEFKTQEYLGYILESLGMIPVLNLVDDIKSYGLMTKRNKTADIITREHVLVFQKA